MDLSDRYVLLGNHRDAWVFGAIDPSSGTAVMKEISRVMGQLVKTSELYNLFQNHISLPVCLTDN